MNPSDRMLAAMLFLAAVLWVARLVYSQHRAGAARAPLWRTALMIVLQVASTILLYLTLVPPHVPRDASTLVVVTANASNQVPDAEGFRRISLPEAAPREGVERVPDLATALRRYPDTQRILVVGDGLTARDRDTVGGIAVTFTPSMPLRGLVQLGAPPPTAAGAAFTVTGLVLGYPGSTIELVDPSGHVIDQRKLPPSGRFLLGGTARVPGLALSTVRLRAADRSVVSETAVPLQTISDPPAKLLLLGAPGPEIKYIRRWASDAGLSLHSQLSAGGGVTIGDAPVALDGTGLRPFDVLIIDERSWSDVSPADRAGIAAAVRQGLGVILRIGSAPSATDRSALRPLGLNLVGNGDLIEIHVGPLASSDQALQARRGPGTADAGASVNGLADPVAKVSRWMVEDAASPVPMLADDSGTTFASWRALGLGRVALWTLADGYALVLNGMADRYHEYWSSAVAAVARPRPTGAMLLQTSGRVGERMALCGLSGVSQVSGPDGTRGETVLPDPATGAARCGAYWPTDAGFRTLVQRPGAAARTATFYVYPSTALVAAARLETREATQRLAAAPSISRTTHADLRDRGEAWPWFLAWLAATMPLWLLERARRRRDDAEAPAPITP